MVRYLTGEDFCKVRIVGVEQETPRAYLIRFDKDTLRWIPRRTIKVFGEGWALIQLWVLRDRKVEQFIVATPQRVPPSQLREEHDVQRPISSETPQQEPIYPSELTSSGDPQEQATLLDFMEG